MPPRAIKKTVSRKPSARAKKRPSPAPDLAPTEAGASLVAAVAVAVGKEEAPSAEAPAAQADVDITAPAVTEEGKGAVVEVKQEAELSQEKKDEKVMEDAALVQEKVGEGAAGDTSKNAQTDITAPAVTEEGKGAVVEVKQEAELSQEKKDEKVMEDAALVQEKVGEGAAGDTSKNAQTAEAEQKIEHEPVAVEEKAEEAASKKVQDSTPVESDQGPIDPEVPAGVAETDKGQNQMDVDKGKEYAIKEETQEDVIRATSGDEDIHDLNDCDTSQSDDDGDSEENEEDVQSLYLHAPMTERKKQKEFEIFIGGLDKGAVDEDLVKVFGVFGEIQSVRIVRNPITQKSKGYAFIRYTSTEHAKKALTELKDGTEIRGKRVGISATQDNDTLYLGNICKSWTNEKVIETLKGYGIEQIENILMPDDPKNEGKNKGFAFLEFNSHSDAMAAFQRLRKPDAVFGRDRSAKVAFAQSPMHPCEEVMLQVKTVYLEGIPDSWNELKIKELCQQYGDVQKVQLFRKSKTKRKDFAFVEFGSRESAVACTEGVNNAQVGEEEVKINANLARPVKKARLAKQGARGGFKVSNDGEAAKDNGKLSKRKKGKLKEVSIKEKSKLKPWKMEQHKNIKFQGKGTKQCNIAQPPKSHKGKRSRAGRMSIDTNSRPSKKAHSYRNFGNFHGTPTPVLDNQRAVYSENPSIGYVTRPTTYASRYPPTATSYQAYPYSGASGSAARPSYLEPRAGYLSYGRQNPIPYGYEQRRFVAYDSQTMMSSDFAGAGSASQTSYPGHSSYEARYSYPSSGVYTGANTHAPYTGGSTHAPSTAGSTHASYTAGSTHAPYTGGSAYAPHGGYY